MESKESKNFKIDEYLAILYKSKPTTAIVDYFLQKYDIQMNYIAKKLLFKFTHSPFYLEDFSFFKYKAVIEALKYYHRVLKFSFLQSLHVILRSMIRDYLRVQINNRNKLLNYAYSLDINNTYNFSGGNNSITKNKQKFYLNDNSEKQLLLSESIRKLKKSNKFSQKDLEIFLLYLEGSSIKDISEAYNISSFKFNKLIEEIKEELKNYWKTNKN
ncbi:hypothetical protein [Mycoplasma sp. SG1]|uniref:hypothetical protein n=1 Tax=Mycoplasma sp. SG1 TaxID=2810348 RepID=UPI002023EE70|nr:hypothetical protein [Mycoplasma sp. SG1]URM52876.1 hypothetical protein JRW51_00830 [Mycoplasma sp. SG1]